MRRAKAAEQDAKNRADAEKKDGKDERMEELLRKVKNYQFDLGDNYCSRWGGGVKKRKRVYYTDVGPRRGMWSSLCKEKQ